MSQPPEHPGSPSDPWGGNPDPGDYPPPGYGPPPGPPPGYRPPSGPPPGYGPPSGPPPGYGPPSGPPPGYGPDQPGYGGPPPPPPGYGPPAGYPPPPPGYGPPPGYPPQPGYPPPGYPVPPGYPPPPGGPFDIGAAFSWAWNKFSKNVGPLILAFLLYFLIGVVLHGLVFVLLGGANANTAGADGDYGASFTAGLDTVGFLVLQIVAFVFGIFVQAAFLSGALDLADGRPVTVGSFFRPRNFGNVILAALLLALITGILNLPSLLSSFIFGLLALVAIAVFTFFALFTIAFATDRGLSPIDALKASFSTVRSNIGNTLLSLVVQVLIVLLGFLACGIGIIVAGPVALLIQVYTYRRLSGGSVAAPTP